MSDREIAFILLKKDQLYFLIEIDPINDLGF